MSHPKVMVIIVNWKGLQDTLLCIQSLLAMKYEPFEILVVDNYSQDGSVESIKQSYPGIHILEMSGNLGYTGGNNVGIKYALENQSDFVFLINNDTLVDPMILSELINFLLDHPHVGIAGPKQYLMDTPTVIASMGGEIDWKIATIIHRFYQYDEKDKGILTLCPQRVDFQDGCAVCIRRELIDKAGLLDERYYLGGYEDAEMGIRAQRHGYEVWNVPSARMWHKVSAAAGIASPLTTYYMTRNALLFFSENSQIYPPTLAVFRILIRTIRTIGAWNLKKKYKDEGYRRKSKANLYAIRDFAYKKYGLMGSDVSNQCQ